MILTGLKYIYLYLYIYIYVCVCMCVCVLMIFLISLGVCSGWFHCDVKFSETCVWILFDSKLCLVWYF